MDKIKRVIDLKKEEEFVEAYVSLRNRYTHLLLTKTVDAAETKKWLRRGDIEARAILWGSDLVGATILYLHRDGEIALFAKEPNQGVGNELLGVIEQVAKEKNLESVWAWVLDDNLPAKRAFQKNGYKRDGKSLRCYEGESRWGVILKKQFLRVRTP